MIYCSHLPIVSRQHYYKQSNVGRFCYLQYVTATAAYIPVSSGYQSNCTYLTVILKCTISDPKFQISLSSEPPDFFLHIQREPHCYKLHIQHFSRKQHIFGERDNFSMLGIYFCWQKLIEASISSNKSFKFQCIFPHGSVMLTFLKSRNVLDVFPLNYR